MSTPRSNGDRTLLDRRDLDLVDAELPRVIDGVRRSRLLARDAVSTTWEGFSLELGSRHWLRCLRPRWRDDAALHRRLSAEGVAGLAPTPTWHGDGDWPHLRWVRPGVPLSELTPVEDEVPQATRVRVLARGLDALDRLHRAGAVVGEPLEHVIAFGSDGPRVLWRDPFEAEGTPEGDMRSLAAAVLALAPHAEDPVSAMVRGWVDHPPLAARDGQALLRQAMAASLLRRRHALAPARPQCPAPLPCGTLGPGRARPRVGPAAPHAALLCARGALRGPHGGPRDPGPRARGCGR